MRLVYLASQEKREFQDSSQRARTQFTAEVGERARALQLVWFSPAGRNETTTKAFLTDEKLTREEAFESAVQISIPYAGRSRRSSSTPGVARPPYLMTRRSIHRPCLPMPRVRKWWAREGRRFYAHTGAFELISEMIEEIEASDRSGAPTEVA